MHGKERRKKPKQQEEFSIIEKREGTIAINSTDGQRTERKCSNT